MSLFDEDLFLKGLEQRKATLGAEYVETNLAAADELTRPFQEAMTAWCWGFGWGDDVIDAKTRSMMNLSMIAALGKMHEWELHCKGALNNGVTPEEIRAIIHRCGYLLWRATGFRMFSCSPQSAQRAAPLGRVQRRQVNGPPQRKKDQSKKSIRTEKPIDGTAWLRPTQNICSSGAFYLAKTGILLDPEGNSRLPLPERPKREIATCQKLHHAH